MESRARLLKHPMHPMLVMFPVAFFPLLVALDALDYLFPAAGIAAAAFWITAGGLALTLVAIVPGLIDLSAIPNETRAHRTAIIHLVVGFAILGLYLVALWARWPLGQPPRSFAIAAGIDLVGALAVTVQGWLGGHLVYHHHVGVKLREEGGEPVVPEGSARTSAGGGGTRRRGPLAP